jgi:hypothetical protein
MPLPKRRDLLQGLGLGAATTLLGPFVEGLVRQAHGQAPAKRLLFIGGWMSFAEKLFRPTVRARTDFDLSPAMAPLAPYKADLTLITDLYSGGRSMNGGHGVMPADFLSGQRSPGWENPAGPTFDRFLGARIGANDRFSSLLLNLAAPIHDGVSTPHTSGLPSWDGPNKPYPALREPIEAFDKIFGKALPSMPDGVDTRALLARDRSLLDFVAKDTARVHARLAAPEGEKLELYVDSLRAIERKLEATAAAPAGGACRAPARPASNGGTLTARAELLVDLAAAALACGASKVATVWLNLRDYGGLGIGGNVHDTVFHASSARELDIQRWRLAQVARAVARTRELGQGDATLVAYADPNGNVHHGGTDTQFFILVGRLGGRLKTGQVLSFPRRTRAVNDVWVAIANAMGVPLESFGEAQHSRGALPGLA